MNINKNIKEKEVVYLRLPTEMQVDSYSLDIQLNPMGKYTWVYDIDIDKVYEHKGKSGKGVEARPYFIKIALIQIDVLLSTNRLRARNINIVKVLPK